MEGADTNLNMLQLPAAGKERARKVDTQLLMDFPPAWIPDHLESVTADIRMATVSHQPNNPEASLLRGLIYKMLRTNYI